MQCLIRKWAHLHKEKKWSRGSGFCKKIPKNAFCKLFFAIPLCFVSKCRSTFVFFAKAPRMQKQNFLCAARARVAKVKFSPRCARQIPEKTGDLVWRCKIFLRAARARVAKAKFSPRCARQGCQSKICSAKIFARAEKMQCLIRKWVVLHKEKK